LTISRLFNTNNFFVAFNHFFWLPSTSSLLLVLPWMDFTFPYATPVSPHERISKLVLLVDWLDLPVSSLSLLDSLQFGLCIGTSILHAYPDGFGNCTTD